MPGLNTAIGLSIQKINKKLNGPTKERATFFCVVVNLYTYISSLESPSYMKAVHPARFAHSETRILPKNIWIYATLGTNLRKLQANNSNTTIATYMHAAMARNSQQRTG